MFRNAILNRPLFICCHLSFYFVDDARKTRLGIGRQRESRTGSCTAAAATTASLRIVVSAATIRGYAAEPHIHSVATEQSRQRRADNCCNLGRTSVAKRLSRIVFQSQYVVI